MEKLKEFMIAVEEEPTLDEVRRLLSEGAEPLDLVEALREAMSAIGERFEKKEYFLSELIMSAEVFNQAMELIVPRLEAGVREKKGKVVTACFRYSLYWQKYRGFTAQV